MCLLLETPDCPGTTIWWAETLESWGGRGWGAGHADPAFCLEVSEHLGPVQWQSTVLYILVPGDGYSPPLSGVLWSFLIPSVTQSARAPLCRREEFTLSVVFSKFFLVHAYKVSTVQIATCTWKVAFCTRKTQPSRSHGKLTEIFGFLVFFL
jgi:hypothetical protein